jgi:molybdopterin-containing oxidoreductase family iron-sulfur binding subunit
VSIKHHVTGQKYWRSLEHLAQSPEFLARVSAEFPGYDPEQIKTGGDVSRRSFMKLMGASMALAGIGLTGCRRWPKEELVPQTTNLEGRIPGLSDHYATVMELGGIGTGLLVTCYDGRPIKIEGNAMHPYNRVTDRYGSADAFAQASVLEMYDPERSHGPLQGRGQPTAKPVAISAFYAEASKLFSGDGAGVAVLSESFCGPTAQDMRKRFLQKFPQAKWYEYEPVSFDNERVATKKACGQVLRTLLHLDKAEIIFSLNSDFLGMHPGHTRNAIDWAARRRSADSDKTMSRVYVAESRFSITGAVADHRMPMRPSEAAAMLTALAKALGVEGAPSAGQLSPEQNKFIEAAAKDLKSAGKNAVVTAGLHLSPEIQALALSINQHLGSIGNTIDLLPVVDPDRPTHVEAISALAKELSGGKVTTLLILGGNPAYDAPADLELGKHIGSVTNAIHLAGYYNETSQQCTWHLPRAHYLESWGDARSYDGTISVQQPMIEPLYDGITPSELLGKLIGDKASAREMVVRTLEPMLALTSEGAKTKDKAFNVVLHDGLVKNSASKPVSGVQIKPVSIKNASSDSAGPDQFEVCFQADMTQYDGRFANNGWLQEMPDTLTKIVWDNAALIHPRDAKRLGITDGDRLKVTVGGKSIEIAAFLLPGQPIGVIGLPLGYGRKAAGKIGNDAGFDVYPLRSSSAMTFASAQVAVAGGKRYEFSTTQSHHLIDPAGPGGMERRLGKKDETGPLIHEMPLAAYKVDPHAAHPKEEGNHRLQLFDPPITGKASYPGAPTAFNHPHAWGMAIDMSACIGCNACMVACQSENNVPIVGKTEVGWNREMHWIRIDRYFKGDFDDPNPEVAFQPLMCVHCENAPCEQVCPVAATQHDTEGINVMVYNRCVGTRYCSNNCPYKVRRFNYYDWNAIGPMASRFPAPWLDMPDSQQVEEVNAIRAMGFNPDVTVRMRGVMEKCTYCLQRISAAKIKAKNDYLAGNRKEILVQEGEVFTACQQACPTQAIVFGNLNDEKAHVSQLHMNPRAYPLLEELNTRPRGRHLARVRNPSPALEAANALKESEPA